MANSIKIGGYSFDALKIGGSDVDAAYLGDTLLYSGGTTPPTPPTPTGSTCYEIISTPITSYTATTYDSVFTYNDAKWYMKNNLSQYEEYGIYDIVENISSATTYEGKLGVVGTTEYQYSGGSWSVVGSYVDSSVTYTIDDTNPSPYVGETLSTTFKIPYADVETISWVDLRIRDNNNNMLQINLNTGGMADYSYQGSDDYNGTVTNDGEYFYLSLPSEAPSSIVINSIDYWNSTPIHLIVGSKQASVEYEEKDIPSAVFYNTVADMEAVGCPTVGINQFAMVGNDIYEYSSNEDWEQVTLLTPKCVAFYSSGNPLVVYDNGDSTLTNAETKINDVSPVSVYIGDSVTTIGDNAFYDTKYPYENNISSVTISSGVTSIGNHAFYECSGLTSVTIPSGVTSIGAWAFNTCSGLTSIDILDSVTSIGSAAFSNCRSLTSITVNATTPPNLGDAYVFNNTNNCPIYVPAASVNAYKSATNWSTYSSRIQAIPNS